MESKQLRLGNYVNYEQTNHIITSINIDFTVSVWVDNNSTEHLYTHQNNELKPILLTEEWLLNFGFDNTKWGYLLDRDYCFDIKEMKFKIQGNFEFETLKEIKYVHELQNLVFILTDNELKIN